MASIPRQPQELLCDACSRPAYTSGRRFVGDLLCERCLAVLAAAQSLQDAGRAAEWEIIPTLAFAALSEDEPALAVVREQCADAQRDSEQWTATQQRFARTFESFWLRDHVDGVPLIQWNPVQVSAAYEPVTGVIEKIQIDVRDLSVRSAKIAELYEKTLSYNELGHNRSDTGMVSWKIYRGAIRVVVRPEDADVDAVRRHMAGAGSQPLAFPPPKLVSKVYDLLRGRKAKGEFQGYGILALSGKAKGGDPEGRTLLSACVAWYFTDRGQRNGPQDKRRITELLGRLSVLGGTSHEQLWRDVGKRAGAIRKVEDDILTSAQERIGLLSNTYF